MKGREKCELFFPVIQTGRDSPNESNASVD
jgi:hypothetical protein